MADVIQLRNGFSKMLVSRDPVTGFESWVILWPQELLDASDKYFQEQYEKFLKLKKRKERKRKGRWYKTLLLIYNFIR